MKRYYPAALAVAAALLPHALWAQEAPKPLAKPLPKQPTAMIWVRWDPVDVPQAEWDTLAPKTSKAGAIQPVEGAAARTLAEKLKAGRYRTVSGPTVTTTDGVEAKINLETKIPFGPAGTKSFLTIGQFMDVLPRLNADGTVTLTLSLRDTEIAGPPPSADAAPPTASMALTTTRTARAGETLVLGGLASTSAPGKSIRVLLLTPTVMRFLGFPRQDKPSDMRVN